MTDKKNVLTNTDIIVLTKKFLPSFEYAIYRIGIFIRKYNNPDISKFPKSICTYRTSI